MHKCTLLESVSIPSLVKEKTRAPKSFHRLRKCVDSVGNYHDKIGCYQNMEENVMYRAESAQYRAVQDVQGST